MKALTLGQQEINKQGTGSAGSQSALREGNWRGLETKLDTMQDEVDQRFNNILDTIMDMKALHSELRSGGKQLTSDNTTLQDQIYENADQIIFTQNKILEVKDDLATKTKILTNELAEERTQIESLTEARGIIQGRMDSFIEKRKDH